MKEKRLVTYYERVDQKIFKEKVVPTDLDVILEKFKDVEPIPGSYLIIKVLPEFKKTTALSTGKALENFANLVAWRDYVDDSPLQAIVVAKGKTLLTVDGKPEPMVFEVGDVIYPSIKTAFETVLHQNIISYHIYQRNIICRVPTKR